MAYVQCRFGRGGGGDVPDGKTVTPINDVEIWQECAGLDPVYDILSDILADSGYVTTLMSSDNAVDYMVRSTLFAKSDAIPTMTSNTTPTGIATAISSYDDQEIRQPYKAFDNDSSTFWCPNAYNNSSWLQYEFPNPVNIIRATITTSNVFTDGSTISNITYSSGDDVSSLTSVASVSPNAKVFTRTDSLTPSKATIFRATFTHTDAARYVGVVSLQFYTDAGITENQTAMIAIGNNNYAADTLLADSTWREAICNSEYFDSVLNDSNPNMTSDTTPSGSCICNGYYSSYRPYCAFDGNTDTFWGYQGKTGYIGYQFTSAKKPLYIKVRGRCWGQSGNITGYKIQGSNDGSNWVDIIDSPTTLVQEVWNGFPILPSESYIYFRLNISATTLSGGYVGVSNLKFYGRQDV